jgi:ABC-type transport system involved in cytochrome c biogenesis permease subunit
MDSSMLHGIATVAYILAMMTYITFLATKKQPVGQAATTIIVIGFVSHTLAFLMRWKEFYDLNIALGMGGDILRATPLTNLYESLIFFVWCLILGYLIVEFKYKNRSFGAFVAPVAGLTLAFIEMSGVSKDIQPLVPALQSNWLLIHVFMSFISYAGFALAFSTALMYLIINTERQGKKIGFWFVFLAFALLFAIVTQNPQTVLPWILCFAIVIGTDVKLNVDIAARIFHKKEMGEHGSIAKTVLATLALSLVSIAAIFIFIQLVKLQLIMAEEAAMLKDGTSPVQAAAFRGSAMGVVGLLLFVGLVFIKYLILEKGYHLFWTITSGIFMVLLIAMGLDFVKFGAPAEGQSNLLKATFLSGSPAVAVVSYAAALAFIYGVWRYGSVLKRIIDGFGISTEMLDEITYKSITIGFPIFTLGGLIFGAIWADQAWGTYWSWDPKETWSLITWFFYAFYLHARLLKGWRGHKIAVTAVVAFIVVIFTYLGVNLLLSGLHAYGSA